MVLVLKWDFFHLFNFGKTGKKKVFSDILERKKAFIAYKNKEWQKIEKLAFLKKGSSMVLVKKWDFFHVFIVAKIGKEKVSVDILKKKNAFLDSTTKQ